MAYYLKVNSDLYAHRLDNKSAWREKLKPNAKSITLCRTLPNDTLEASLEYSSDIMGDIMAKAQPFPCLSRYTSLEEFQISNVALSVEEVFSLSQALSSCQNLRVITLNNVGLTDEGLKVLATNLLVQSGSIQEIHLAANNITNKGLCSLVESIRKNTDSYVQVIDLRHNNIQEQGVFSWFTGEACGLRELFKLLENNQKIKNLNLENNQISSEFLKVSLSVLEQSNTTLTELKVSSGKIEISAKCKSLGTRNTELAALKSFYSHNVSSDSSDSAVSQVSALSNNGNVTDILGVNELADA